MRLWLTYQVLFGIFLLNSSVNGSRGSVWPQPLAQVTEEETVEVSESFIFSLTPHSHSCDLLTEAFNRYQKLVRSLLSGGSKLHFRPKSSDIFTSLNVELGAECEYFPHDKMNEAYDLRVNTANDNILYSESVWGIIRGLETFSQLFWKSSSGETFINKTSIVDAPRFGFRGIMIDTSRHYLPTNIIFKTLDAMAYSKFNVLHWHIVDDSSFPYVSKAYPSLHKKGSYNPTTHVYTPENVMAIIEYARLRGIRVVPEFDTPGHTQSWSQPGLLTTCYSNGKPNGNYGPINPINEQNYEFMKNLLTELREVFKDKFFHIGGDEVNFNCWKSNPEITKYMEAQNITGNYAKLEQEYIQKVIGICNGLDFSYIVWQEVIDNGVKAKKDTVVEVWKGNVQQEIAKVTQLGYRVLIAQPWYLNYISYGQDWKRYYRYEPLNFNGTEEQKSLVLGGEACIWGEYVDSTNILSRLWPRACAVAERLWSAEEVNDTEAAFPRLREHRCRMIKRGIPAEPLFTGHCDEEWNG